MRSYPGFALVAGCLVLAGAATAMDVKVLDDQVIMSGPVDGTELAKLRDVAAGDVNARVRTVVLRDSPGGDLWTSMHVGDFIRDKGWRTAVSGYCFSGCALMFLGGRARHFTDDSPAVRTQLGFHGTYHVAGASGGTPGTLHQQQTYVARDWIKKRTDGRISESMLDRFENLAQSDFIHFFDSSRLPRKGQVSAFVCPIEKDSKRKCQPVVGADVYQEGIATSTDAIRSNDRSSALPATPAGSLPRQEDPAK